MCYVPGDDLFQVRGQNGLLQNSMDPLPELTGKQEMASTVDHVLETFYPVSPTIDLQQIHEYKEEENCTGEKRPSLSLFPNLAFKGCCSEADTFLRMRIVRLVFTKMSLIRFQE